ncbi:MAG: IPT/TIG domain-containing protein [Myxococcota bacterium]
MNRALIVVIALAGCSLLNEGPQAYYGQNWSPPTVSSLSPASEAGNIGGGIVEIAGSGFGDDPNQVLVQFGDENAEILEISDERLVVTAPPGPITGGAVPVRVATATGFNDLDTTYTYEVGGIFDEQIGYVQINNFWESCYGGLSDRLDEEYAEAGALGCNQIAFIGYTGIAGQASELDFQYPRLHAEQVGFWGGTDFGNDAWSFERPGQIGYAAMVDDLHRDIGRVRLRNEVWAGDDYCVDLDSLAYFYYGGGELTELEDGSVEDNRDPAAVTAADYVDGHRVTDNTPCVDGEVEYPLDTLDFCTSAEADGAQRYVYEADWPVPKNFFAGEKNDWTVPTEIALDVESAGIEGQQITLPESLVVEATEGFDPLFEFAGGTADLWSLSQVQGCFDDDGDGEKLDDVAISFRWEPSTFDPATGGHVLDSRTYVRVTLTGSTYNWFGPSAYPVRATLIVPDDHNYERGLGSRVDVPASVLYQFPTIQFPQAGNFGGETQLLDPAQLDYGLFIITFERITEYELEGPDGGTLVFSYVTGDFGYFDWANPVDADGCHNCSDDDGDGWADADDPDCAGGTEETGYGEDACNDGRDNDDDGRSDVEDPFCEDGNDDDESNCDDGRDNDADGAEDLDDTECADGDGRTNEGSTVVACENGEDDDADGWVDVQDPDCADGDEELGLGQDECNDGLDNDEDGVIDVEDTDCTEASGTEATEASTGCDDRLDNDEDGWTDTQDPDCATGTEEVGYGSTECNDGLDNDTDEAVDVLDPECADASDAAEGA